MYIAIEGVIGVGKTTLARLLKANFEAELLLEILKKIPFSVISTVIAPVMLSRRRSSSCSAAITNSAKASGKPWGPIPG